MTLSEVGQHIDLYLCMQYDKSSNAKILKEITAIHTKKLKTILSQRAAKYMLINTIGQCQIILLGRYIYISVLVTFPHNCAVVPRQEPNHLLTASLMTL